MLNVICFASCIEGLFFYGAFAYVYFLRSRGLLNGLAAGTNWVFRDESMHMKFAFDVVDTSGRKNQNSSTTRWSRRCGRCWPKLSTVRSPSLRTYCSRAFRECRPSTCAPTWRMSRTGDSSNSGSSRFTDQEPLRIHGVAGRTRVLRLLRTTGVCLSSRHCRNCCFADEF